MSHITFSQIQTLCSSTINTQTVTSLLRTLQLQSVSDDDVLASMMLVKQFVAPTKYNQLALLLEELKQIDTETILMDSNETQELKQKQQALLAQQEELTAGNKATASLRTEIQELESSIESLEQEIQTLEKELLDD